MAQRVVNGLGLSTEMEDNKNFPLLLHSMFSTECLLAENENSSLEFNILNTLITPFIDPTTTQF